MRNRSSLWGSLHWLAMQALKIVKLTPRCCYIRPTNVSTQTVTLAAGGFDFLFDGLHEAVWTCSCSSILLHFQGHMTLAHGYCSRLFGHAGCRGIFLVSIMRSIPGPWLLMRHLMWHPCQKDVASCFLQLLDRIDEREREIQIVHSASLAYEDESVFTFCALLRMAVRQWLTAF